MRFLIILFLVQILLFLGLFYGIKASVFFNFSLSANHGILLSLHRYHKGASYGPECTYYILILLKLNLRGLGTLIL